MHGFSRARGWSWSTFLIVLAIGSPTASAQWQWSTTSTCLNASVAERAITRARGAAAPPDLRVQVSIEGERGAWRASIEVRDVRGTARRRALASEEAQCGSLDDAVVVVTALLIDEVLALAPTVPLAIVPVRQPPPGSEHQLGRRSNDGHWTGTVRTSAIARIDELPGFALGAALEVEVAPPSVDVPIVMSVGVFPPVERLDAGRGGRFVAAFAALGTCPMARVHPAFEIGGCGFATATYILAEGVGLTSPNRSEGFSIGAHAGGFARLRLHGALWLRASLGVDVSFLRPRAVIHQGTEEVLIHQVAPVIPEASVGVEIRFQ